MITKQDLGHLTTGQSWLGFCTTADVLAKFKVTHEHTDTFWLNVSSFPMDFGSNALLTPGTCLGHQAPVNDPNSVSRIYIEGIQEMSTQVLRITESSIYKGEDLWGLINQLSQL